MPKTHQYPVYGHILRQHGTSAPPLLTELRGVAVAGILRTLQASGSALEAAKNLGITYHSLVRIVRQHWTDFGEAYDSCVRIAQRPKSGLTAFVKPRSRSKKAAAS